MPKSGGKRERGRFFIKFNDNRLQKAYFFALAFLIIILDQLSKSWIVRQFEPGESRAVLEGIFYLTYVRNPGAAFGILAFRTSFFIIVSLLMIFLILYGERYFSEGGIYLRLGLSLELGGAAGNLVDRIRYGYVIDFFDFQIWPVFNVADIAVVIGIVFLIYSLNKNRSYFFK